MSESITIGNMLKCARQQHANWRWHERPHAALHSQQSCSEMHWTTVRGARRADKDFLAYVGNTSVRIVFDMYHLIMLFMYFIVISTQHKLLIL